MELIRKYPRTSGVLMPIPALSGPFGIGVLGQEAKDFIDFISQAGFHAWQVLPVEHTGSCNSPYKCISAYAGEPMLIDLRFLQEMGLLTDEEIEWRMDGMAEGHIEYETIRKKQSDLLWAAFLRLEGTPYESFQAFWLEEYALYMAIKHRFDYAAWYEWEDEKLRSHDETALAKFSKENREYIEFYKFVQWLFDFQWKSIRQYAKERNISLIGDMPVYVSEDSADVWSRRELFNAATDGKFESVGGCPPDYFAPEGQLWGNPIYNWEMLKDENYEWWINRLKVSLNRYDVVRLDHFRAFESYWSIPGDVASALKGKWQKGPGMALFNALENSLGNLTLSVIAEDLGMVDQKVAKLLKDTGLRGMRVLQFGFLGDEHHLPHNYPEESAAYTGTHDNTTLIDWQHSLNQNDRDLALFYTGFEGDWTIGGPNCPIIKSWMRTIFMSSASIVVVPIQDILGYGRDTRTNTPGTAQGNWRFRLRYGVLDEVDTGFYNALHKSYQREDSVKSFKPKPKKKEIVE